jgi:hypothetical protein
LYVAVVQSAEATTENVVSCPKGTFERVVPAAGVNVEMITDAISFIYQNLCIFC